MTTKQTYVHSDSIGSLRRQSSLGWLWAAAGAICLAAIAYFAREGAVSPRIANPTAPEETRPVRVLLDWGDNWLSFLEWGTVVFMLVLIGKCIQMWRRQPGHPYVLMTIASTAIVWQDPIMNWSPYAVYNPQLWHWPEDWPLVNLSPTVEPFVVIGYAVFYFGPFFPANAWLRRLQARASVDAFVWRHPLISLAALTLLVGFLFDAALEISLVHTGMYIYSQVVPWGSLFAGTPFQFPLIWESALVCVVMVPASVLSYRDDTGRTQAEKLVQRFRWLPNHPALGTFLMMFAILNVAYFVYGGAFAAIRVTGVATAVACPYPYRDAKVYDPQGYYEREGEPGPYFEGYWNGWMTGQPGGRPEINTVKPDGMCKRGSQ